jgi:hypothetical protein
MTIQTVEIIIDRQVKQITPGLKTGNDLRTTAGNISADERLLLEITGDADVPLDEEDQILITGGERFSIGKKHHGIEDNPQLRHPIIFGLNEASVPAEKALKHAKVMPVDILRMDEAAIKGSRLLADLEGLADELIDLERRIIVKPGDQFIVLSPLEDNCPRQVTVTIDGREVMLNIGTYTGTKLKALLSISEGYDLDVWNGQEFVLIADEENFDIRKSEAFASHARTGSSS